tara:strand:- start:6771 stop:7526 length:756 start_codon:yes stop_codon:yes gene_type:complete
MQLNNKIILDGNFLFKYRGQIPIFILILAIPILWKNDYYTIYTTAFKSLFQLTGIILGLSGLILRYYTIGTTPNKTSGRNRNQQIAETLNTTGCYSMTRNPLYFANWMIWLGLSLFTLNYVFMLITILLFHIVYERIILAEEQFLLKKFKKTYSNFCNDVPVFFPNLYNFKKSKHIFSFKKILRQEYSSTLSTIVSFIYLDIITQIICSKKSLGIVQLCNDIYIYIFILLISGYIALCLKIFRTYTTLLDD